LEERNGDGNIYKKPIAFIEKGINEVETNLESSPLTYNLLKLEGVCKKC